MKLERIALIAEIFGGLAVIVSVIYLAIQISDNNRLLRSQSHYNALEVTQRPLEVMLESEGLVSKIQACENDPEAVSDAVWALCANFILMQANGWEYTYYQHQDKTVPASFWEGVDAYMTNEARTKPSWARFWLETSDAFGEPFKSYVYDRISANPANLGTEQ